MDLIWGALGGGEARASPSGLVLSSFSFIHSRMLFAAFGEVLSPPPFSEILSGPSIQILPEP